MTSDKPDWLPDIFQVSSWQDDTFDLLYEIFQKDFITSQPFFRGINVWSFPEKEDGREKIFWHLTSRKDPTTGERLPDLRRSELLPWVRSMIEHPDEPEVLTWNYEEGDKDIHTYIWLHQFDFVVIMKKYPDGRRRLITSFWIEYPRKKRELRKKYEERIR